ncbi:MAG: IS4 family transposase, partial [Anaerolineaceae bacterium]|nr:IS4 family transposase [Anaerolineaceae bacterium]
FYHRIYTPLVTVLVFVAQVLDSDRSCRKAVSRLVELAASSSSQGQKLSQNTAAYCKARSRLPLSLIWNLIHWSERRIDAQIKQEDLWLRRHKVWVVDGSSCQTPDTEANREAFGLPSGVKLGCGFPVLPFVGVFSLMTGLFKSLRFGKKGGHERHLFRELMVEFSPGDVIVGDRGFCSFADICLLKQRDVECVLRIFNRKPDYQTGERLGKRDHIVEWTKPKVQPAGMSAEEYAALPEKLRVREVRIVVEQKGFRSKTLDIVTTLFDAKIYTKEAIASLYRRRWSIELNFRHIKTTLGMELLSTKTPEMAHKEVLIFMLAYNLIRSLIWAAKQTYRIDIERISFKGTLQHLATASPYLAIADPSEYSSRYEKLIESVSNERLPDRPDRVEPRVVKRRPKKFSLMTQPRSVLKAKLAA